MVKKCAIKGCKSEEYDGCGISFFKLPKDEAIKSQWFQIIPSSLTNHSVICSRHFKPEDIINNSSLKPKLRPGAVPSTFLMSAIMDSVEESPTASNILENNEGLQSLLKTIIDKCKSEAKYKTLHVPLEEYESRVSYYTGIPREYIQEVTNKMTEPKKKILDISQRILIHDTLRKFYEQGKRPAYKDVYEVLKNMSSFSELTQFTEELKEMGFDYRKLVCGKMLLMEDPKITFERCLYLTKIKKIRSSNSQIYYIDERIIDKELSFKKQWLSDIDKNLIKSGNAYIYFNVVTPNATNYYKVYGLFCNQASESDFQKWFIDVLLYDLKPLSTIIMDKSPLHGVLEDKTISRYHPKGDMLKWLKENDIPCTANMNKAQLYELIRKCPTVDKEFTIDRILRAHGHNVLRVPTHIQNLSPIELMWQYLSTNNLCNTELEWESIQSKIIDSIQGIPVGTWTDIFKTIESFEDNLLRIDAQIEKSLENYKFSVQ